MTKYINYICNLTSVPKGSREVSFGPIIFESPKSTIFRSVFSP